TNPRRPPPRFSIYARFTLDADAVCPYHRNQVKSRDRGTDMLRRLAAVALLSLFALASAPAQEQRGQITGTVFDQQGAVVPGASISVTDNGTGAVFTGKSTGEGAFTIPGLPFGTYSLSITAQGFRKWETKSVQVITSQEAVVKAVLEVGQTTDTVTVETAQVSVNTVSGEL